MDLRIVDTHVHVASQDSVRYPRVSRTATAAWYERGDADVTHLLAAMDRCGVDAAVLVQAHGPYRDDNRYCADARALAPHRLASVSIVDVTRADCVERLEHWADRGMAGTRLVHLPPVEPPWLADRATEPLWRRAAALGLRVNVCTVRRYLPLVEQLLTWAPRVPIALDHSALVDLGAAVDAAAYDEVCALARHEHVHLKISPHVLAYASTRGQTAAELVRDLAGVFGADRLMWSSDWPNAGHSYEQLVRDGVESAALLTDADRARYLGGTARTLWPELTGTR
ncbi:MAG TPA: amidohydrolase family protein [Acidimicrobiales bacterium]|nr:amidohydrolase family protein [Acidimicrobiales bacterium]